ncbi:MAG TPA: peptide chain release factor N(5)-glutamine methyltransferase [Hyphomonadaceae bacterium]|nr:peptide chain release factor N(5)-glutamine methyltransferase [Hyphomonadaceae bacterium]
MSLHCSWRDMMREAAQRLAVAGVENAPRDARLLLAQALGVEPVEVILRETDAIDPLTLTQFETLIERRLAGEPVSRIRGCREFYGREFAVTPAVLDPRPETELLVSEGMTRLPEGGGVLDLGTGSGCILLSVLAERPDATGVGVDISSAALDVAKANAAALGIERATFVQGSWDAPLSSGEGGFDVVLSNPPYVAESEFDGLATDVRAYDPKIALVSGGDGLDPYRRILDLVDRLVKPGGSIGFEFGWRHGEKVRDMMEGAGLTGVILFRDLAGTPRAAFGRRVRGG